jgi:hypothetical protein
VSPPIRAVKEADVKDANAAKMTSLKMKKLKNM